MEKLSWSHKLFLRINTTVGNRPWLDRVMFASAHWLIYPLFLGALLSVAARAFPATPSLFKEYCVLLAIALGLAYCISYGIAWLFPHDRPVKEFPYIKELVHPFFLWKSFPSDHTITVTILSYVSALFLPVGVTVLISLLALLVATARVYVGVHYPRDIVGGVMLGLVVAEGVVQIAPWW